MHSFFSLVQLQLDWKICFSLDDNKIVHNSKSNAKFTKTLTIYFAKLRSTFFQDFLFRKNHPFFEIWVFYTVLLLPYLKELWRERIGVYTQAKKNSLISGNRPGEFFLSPIRPHKSSVHKNIYFLFQKKTHTHKQKNFHQQIYSFELTIFFLQTIKDRALCFSTKKLLLE